MKKLLVLLIAMVYATISSGMMVHIHYCMGKLASVGVQEKKARCKCSPAAEKKMPCCKTEAKWVKLNDGHEAGSISEVPPASHLLAPANRPQAEFWNGAALQFVKHYSRPPNLPDKSRSWLLNRVFRI